MSNEKAVKISQLTNSIKQMSDYLNEKIEGTEEVFQNIQNINFVEGDEE